MQCGITRQYMAPTHFNIMELEKKVQDIYGKSEKYTELCTLKPIKSRKNNIDYILLYQLITLLYQLQLITCIIPFL